MKKFFLLLGSVLLSSCVSQYSKYEKEQLKYRDQYSVRHEIQAKVTAELIYFEKECDIVKYEYLTQYVCVSEDTRLVTPDVLEILSQLNQSVPGGIRRIEKSMDGRIIMNPGCPIYYQLVKSDGKWNASPIKQSCLEE